jgi:hypothetical protein
MNAGLGINEDGCCLTKQRLTKASVLKIFIDQQPMMFLYTASPQLDKVSMLDSADDYHFVQELTRSLF